MDDGSFEVGCTSINRDELMILERLGLQANFAAETHIIKACHYGVVACHLRWR